MVASRLSENPAWTVLLLEAGGDPPLESQIPSLLLSLQKTEHDWAYTTEPCKTGALASGERGNFWPRGRMLGGTSAMNALLYVRGNRRDFDEWAAANPGWSYDDVLPLFRRSEDNGADARQKTPEYHGRGGPLRVNNFENCITLREVLKRGVLEMGERWLEDVHGAEALGFCDLQGTVGDGERQSAAKAFLSIARDRRNLHVIKHAHVTQLLFADGASRCDGVEFRLRGHDEPLQARTTKEVILSAGALNSPQILQLSGIGPAAHLRELGIPMRLDLAVGDNLQDHLIVPYLMTFDRGADTPEYSLATTLDSYGQWLMTRSGRLASIGLTSFGGFVNTTLADDGLAYPDIQFHTVYFERAHPAFGNMLRMYGYSEAIVESLLPANATREVCMWAVTLLRPKSAGTVRLRSRDPLAAPLLQHNYLAEPADVDAVVRGLRWLQRFEKTAAFATNGGAHWLPTIAECDALPADSDAYWALYARYMATTLYHPACTTKMAPAADGGAVVDAELRVHGVQGLRVADAGVMPAIVSANTNAATIMIGEKAAEMLRTRWADA